MRKDEKWVVLAKSADFKGIGETYGVDPVIARIVRNREVTTPEGLEEYFHPSPEHLHEPGLLKGAVAAAELLAGKIREKKRIRIIGDYDIDGVCATYILYRGLRDCGAVVDYVLPHRINDGYGLNERLVRAAGEEQVEVLLTCDNGIAAAHEIALAKELGMTVVVTDHHEIPLHWEGETAVPVLPPADVVVDPKQPGDTYPDPGICGAVVAWKLLLLVQRLMGQPSDWREYIAFAAFATIGDVMELRGENRTIASLGLAAIARTDNVGLLALIRRNGLEPEHIRAYHVGFVIGPCINASGRLDTASRALELLLEEDEIRASRMAEELVSLNESRKELTARGVEDAIAQVEAGEMERQPVLVVYLPDCHESLAGIIAGRLRERYYRPVFVLTPGEEGLKGSGRSIPAYHMYEHMSRVGHLFTKFGGHAMAAGLSMPEENLDSFRRTMCEDAGLSHSDLTEKICIDVPMPITYISESLVGQLALLEPCGNGNEKPIFADRDLRARRAYFIGRERRMLKLSMFCGERLMDALYFGDADEFLDYYREKYGPGPVQALLAGQPQEISFAFTYYPQVNEYQGTKNLQIVISHYM